MVQIDPCGGHFISYFTVEPRDNEIDTYLDEVFNQLLSDTKNQFYFLVH